jgi:hypothetical protein
MREQGQLYKQTLTQIQSIKVEAAFQPLPEAETVVEKTKPSGTLADWMQAAGISSADYDAVNFILSHESGFNPLAINASSGAYGLCQALPGSKMSSVSSDWQTNAVTQLKWCDQYAKSRYNGWQQAQVAWVAKGWW